MDTKQSSPTVPPQILELHGKLAVELAFVMPDQDSGLLPINSILMDLEDELHQDAPTELVSGVAVAKGWLDKIFDGNGKFSAQTITNFTTWHEWMGTALSAWERGEEISSMPGAGQGDPKFARNETSVAPPLSAKGLVPSDVASTPDFISAPEAGESEEKAILLNLKDDADLLHEFHGESVELLQNIEQGLLILEENPNDSNTINSIFRAFHTFKGGAGFLHLHALQDLAHDLESLLDAVRQSKLQISSAIINIILDGSDALKHYTNEIGHQIQGVNPGQPIVVPTARIIRKVKAILSGEPLPEESLRVASSSESSQAPEIQGLHETFSPKDPDNEDDSLTPGSGDWNKIVFQAVIDQSQTTPDKTLAKQDPLITRPVPEAGKQVAVTESASGFVKLETWKLDALVDLVGELVIAQSMVVQDPDVLKQESRTLARSLRQLSRTTSELQRNAMSLRMVPVRAAFQKMTRLVRDVGVQTGKQVQLILEGEDTELDRNIVEKLGDPLVHMIRNAVDHGIELPDTRAAKGKSRLGTVRLSASHQRGGILIRIQDDGKGLNAEKLLEQGVKRGIVKEGSELTNAEIYNLIFEPGFSTAEIVSDLSGRGVGMDVVKRNIESLRGKIEIHSEIGQGSTFNIILPLTLAIIDGMLVGVGDERFIIPTIAVRESFRPRPGMVSTIHEKGALVSVRGKQTPVLPLGKYLGIPTKASTPEEGIMIVVESGDASRAILVDELIGKQEVVIKSLGETFKDQNLLAGGAVLGDGSVGLILDVDTLVKL
jgi:two-component system chemotaxis sensor kinase CheA